MEFMFWFSLFFVFAWYQQQHYEKFNGTSKNFYALLSAYCLLNCVLGFVVVYLGIKTVGWWFLVLMVFAPLIMQSLLVMIENLLFGGHSQFKLSFAGLLLIPVAVSQIIGWKWSLLYVLTLIVYLVPVIINIVKRKEGNF